MAKCEYCGKDVSFGIKVSHSHRRSNRTWKPNVRRVKAVVNGTPKRVYACTRCLRSGKVTRAIWFQYMGNPWTFSKEKVHFSLKEYEFFINNAQAVNISIVNTEK